MDSLPERPAPPRSLTELAVAWLRWFGVGRLVATVLAVAAVGVGGVWLLRPPQAPVEQDLPFASRSVVSSGSGESGESGASDTKDSTSSSALTPPTPSAVVEVPIPVGITVHVAGAVASAGVYHLATGSRLEQAVNAAGGLSPEADLDAINLAGFVADGDRLFVPRIGVAIPAVVTPPAERPGVPGLAGPGSEAEDASAAVSPGPIDLNSASADELDELPGIGPSTAAAIVTHREQIGPFSSVDDLLAVRGIGPAKLDAIRALVTA